MEKDNKQQWIRKSNDDTISDKEDEYYHNLAQNKFKLLSSEEKIIIIKDGKPGYSEYECICDTVVEGNEIDRRIYEFCIQESIEKEKNILLI